MLGSIDYGDYKVAEAFIRLGSIFVLMGGGKAVARFLPDQIRSRNGEGVWEYFRFYFFIIIFLSSALFVAVYFAHIYHFSVIKNYDYHPILIAALAVPFAATSALLGGILQIAKRLDLAFIPWRVGYPALRLLVCGCYFLLMGSLTDLEAIFITMFIAIIIALYCLKQVFSLSLMPLQRTPNQKTPIKWLRVSTPLMIVLVLQTFTRQIDIYMIELISGEVAVGHFAAAQTTADAITYIQMALFALITPLIVPALNSGTSAMIKLNRKSLLLMLKSVLPTAIIICILGHPILQLFGHDTELAYQSMLTLLIGYSTMAIIGISALWLQYSGKEKLVMMILFASVLINGLLNWFLIPILDIEGAAIATSISLLLAATMLCISLKRHLSIFPWSIKKQQTYRY
ncbi:MAG: oligosaccharide flippase family protein [Shewanella sp.]|nr:oligosaccharide flippase family protein [Shewanella sp.]